MCPAPLGFGRTDLLLHFAAIARGATLADGSALM
jgi:hypothetical protein